MTTYNIMAINDRTRAQDWIHKSLESSTMFKDDAFEGTYDECLDYIKSAPADKFYPSLSLYVSDAKTQKIQWERPDAT